ncbi:MAG: arsenate reductase ArsC [Betaproteobacteria bacterium]|nr:arsenate reductase ArsC [Betaproteobacteria bacterium]
MADRLFNVLFLCTHNSARSVMAEALLNTIGRERFQAFSAGSMPSGRVNPFAIEMARTIGYLTENVRSKSWDEYAQPGAQRMDIIITVCDDAAGEVCPVWPGHPATAHWGFPDPSNTQGSDAEKRHAFEQVFHAIRRRIELLVNLPVEKLEHLALANELKRIHAQ